LKKQTFHNKHEMFTELAYNTPDVLPDRYVFVLTNLCNLKCDFCYMKKNVREDAMAAGDWIALTEQLPDYARVTLCGGEPLVFQEFDKVFGFVAQRFDCNLISNGILLTEEKIDYLLSFPKFKVLSLSIDDIGNVGRGVSPKQWKHLEKMIKYFIKKRDETGSESFLDIKTMILDKNAENLFGIYKYFVEELNIDTHSFQFLKGSPIQHADQMFEFAEINNKSKAPVYKKFDLIKDQLNMAKEYNHQHKKVSFLHPKVESLDVLNNADHVKDDFSPCKFPWSSAHINVDGTVFPCLALSLGNVKNTPLKEIINGEKLKRFKELIKKEGTIESCNRCGWLRSKGSNN